MPRLLVFGALVACVLAGTTAHSGPSAAAVTSDVRVGSFNLSSVTFDSSAGGDHRLWRDRRDKVASQILSSRLDVVGVQEANPSSVYKTHMVNGANQYMDLKNALNQQGGNYALTNEAAYNCVNPASTYKCVYQYQGAALDDRILYDTDKLSVVHRGSYKFPTQNAGKYERYLIWAVLKVKATGKQFVFTNTHLDPYSPDVRVAQWKQAIAKAKALEGNLPIVAVGDYNTTKFSTWAEQMLPNTKSEGMNDVLNQHYQVNPQRVQRAESTVRGYLNSFNGFRRDASTYCYCSRRDKLGNNIDWIFASDAVRVKDWEIVVDINSSTMQLNGVIPSDHNLVRSTLVLP